MKKKGQLNIVLLTLLFTLIPTIVIAGTHNDGKLSSTAQRQPPVSPKMEGDKPRGQLLYETHCSVCHTTSVHKRNPRKADSIGKIKYWVTRWSTELKLNWSSSDVDAVAQYLNSKYYNFKE